MKKFGPDYYNISDELTEEECLSSKLLMNLCKTNLYR